jgi:carbon monoxide dehydrogenase subunit G
MPHFDLTIDISRPPEDVFALLTDIERLPEWQSSAVSAAADGELAVGTVIGEQRRFMGRDISTRDQITAFEPGRRFDVKSLDAPVTYEIHHTLEPHDAGTRLRVEVDVKVGTMMRIAAQPALKAAERELRSDFERLKELLEA